MEVLSILVGLVGLYLLCGLVLTVPWVLKGAGVVDPVAKGGTWEFRLIIN